MQVFTRSVAVILLCSAAIVHGSDHLADRHALDGTASMDTPDASYGVATLRGAAAAVSSAGLHSREHGLARILYGNAPLAFTALRDEPFTNGTIDGHSLPEWFSVVFNGVLMGAGLFEVVAGYRLFRVTMMMLSAIAAGLPVFLLTWDNIQGANAFWIGVGMGGMAALIAAVASYFLYKVGVFLIGAALGVIVALVLNTSILYKLSPDNPNLPLIIGGVLLGLGMGALSLRFMRISVITSTSVVGAYAFIRAVGHFAGGYPANEFDIEQELQNGQTNLPWTIYAYFAGWVVLWVVGICLQVFVTARKTSSGKDDNEKAFDESMDPLDLVLGKTKGKKGKKGKKEKKGKSKGAKGVKAGKAAGLGGTARSAKVDALLRDYDEGGEFYEGDGQGGDEYYDEDGEGDLGYGYEGQGGGGARGLDDSTYGYDDLEGGAGGYEDPRMASPPARGGLFSNFGGGRAGKGAGKGGASKKQPAAINW